MSYLYDEMAPEARATFQTHLASCAECRAQLNAWQQTTRQMSEWKLPAKRKAAAGAALTRWAIAAALAGLAIIGGVRAKALNDDVRQLRAEMKGSRGELETAVRQQLAEEMQRELGAALAQVTEQTTKSASAEAQSLIAAVAQKLEEKRLTDQQTTLAALQKLSAQHIADYTAFRKELETVAVFTEAGWQRAQNQIATLADASASFSENK
jgi:hypothetical protein